jgi:hypothetical protein
MGKGGQATFGRSRACQASSRNLVSLKMARISACYEPTNFRSPILEMIVFKSGEVFAEL